MRLAREATGVPKAPMSAPQRRPRQSSVKGERRTAAGTLERAWEDLPEVVGEDEEADEGEQEREVHLAEGGAAEEKRGGEDGHEEPGVGKEAEDGEEAEGEEYAAEGGLGAVGEGAMVLEVEVDGLVAQGVGEAEEEECAGEGHGERGGEKVAGGDEVGGVEEEVLGVADGGGHGAEVGGDGLEGDEAGEAVAEAQSVEGVDGEGDEGDEGDVVGGDHRDPEGELDEGVRQRAEARAPGQEALGEDAEEAAFPEPGHDEHQAEEEVERAQVDGLPPGAGIPHEEEGEGRRREGGDGDGVGAEGSPEGGQGQGHGAGSLSCGQRRE